ncbi:16S rRNA (uracil(1498)-N(3))-methyltransferase [Xanthomonas translucens pv. translucens]|uniref:16S rRNA (uracil(1498)-N(3))-methyltransferase n=4 Tax=Xanthomonas campestris pv. translucens TaxID=343 RepID=UPI001F15A09D|nr:16S rRNA (uracil(1498)-N(3))-methyltransferase [Xanthomonas translucens]MCS3358670.1 16S rRNA (uracil(1498)-N(3))-methyltransferase [Xanthomonas translucens pv. translucens]MCS3372839.1 16S rRNA (uracil(1498)-N(3))-methyltransferase [Xanthomonas translucens pv. translucens]MCT8290393.1 16S rRNA (uracil(1498)-N(3))-methyltransferase [Xanthomonas translucens pv. translucens]MCT8291793.1 16S rRNA (uracil(1498)-N(3))-methyltransferase [Xanthomonas translucens pv. translucens]MCT8311740.1 16S rR
MRLTRCHVALPLCEGEDLVLPEDVSGHLLRVLRLREGDRCVLFNGDGCDYDAELLQVGKRGASARIGTAQPAHNESPLAITLLQGVARGEKMDLILQKATELGVAAIVPVWAERTEVKLDAARTDKRVAHWRSVVVAACEQSGRARVPSLAAPLALADAAAAVAGAQLKLTLDPQGEQRLRTLDIAGNAATIAIGPEGGWSPRDRAALHAAGFAGLRLGPRILRTETAGLAAIAALQARCGDL